MFSKEQPSSWKLLDRIGLLVKTELPGTEMMTPLNE